MSQCPRCDSNAHCAGFESAPSADWGTGAYRPAAAAGEPGNSLTGGSGPSGIDRLPRVSSEPIRVLIAEDEALIRLDLKEMLEEEGYTVVAEAGDGQQAVDRATELRPDLVILDIQMPVLDGLAAAEQIASARIAPVIVLTAFSQRELVERARDAGAMAYLVKPFSKNDLVPAIEVARGRFAEMTALDGEVRTLEERLETRKVIEQAKGKLMADQGMTEAEAFRWIQRTAMNERTSMKALAERVLQAQRAADPTAGGSAARVASVSKRDRAGHDLITVRATPAPRSDRAATFPPLTGRPPGAGRVHD
jgi:AmiR/NasT family two-component response regulator